LNRIRSSGWSVLDGTFHRRLWPLTPSPSPLSTGARGAGGYFGRVSKVDWCTEYRVYRDHEQCSRQTLRCYFLRHCPDLS
jgi:hypothetical protein